MALLIAFSGQGCQTGSMMNRLKADEYGRAWLQDASKLLGVDVCNEAVVGAKCDDVLYAQWMIVLLSVGAFRALLHRMPNLQPVLCGYSLGEISAFCASTQMPLDSILECVKVRTDCIQAALSAFSNHPAGLVVLKGRCNREQIQLWVKQFACYEAIVIADDPVVVGGFLDNLERLMQQARGEGVTRVLQIRIHFPSHTPLLNAASEPFQRFLFTQFASREMTFPIIDALNATRIQSIPLMLPVLANELSCTLRWDRVLAIAGEYQVSTCLELGPGVDLKRLFTEVYPDKKAYALDDFLSVDGLISFFSLVKV